MPDTPVLFCVDMGTTRTRVWLTQGDEILAYRTGDFGVRDTASAQTPAWLRAQLLALLEVTQAGAPASRATAVLAAGMITSDRGLREVPHVPAPAGLDDLARALHRETFANLPLFLVPGIRTGAASTTIGATLDSDLMRGEETLCLGLLAAHQLGTATALLHLGSHWKWIWTDEQNRIARSRTTLTGEMIHALQAHTILAAALPQHPPETLEPTWFQRGFDESARSGLSRALFCVRLLEQQRHGSPEDRLSFLYGAVLQTELTHLPPDTQRILIAGPTALAAKWKLHAERAGLSVTVLTQQDRDAAFLLGLRSLYARL